MPASSDVRALLHSVAARRASSRRHELLPAATTCYLIQNACIGTSAACALALLKFKDMQLPEQARGAGPWG